ncbi:MAG: uroporphyrinogen-III synthase [Elusimicrobia bacterium]|nr:uroporphyrinogen-III synthase [Elusimicrobiota bacterium]
MRPLSGQTVLVTRPKNQGLELAERLRRLGAKVIRIPLIRTAPPPDWRPLDKALQELKSFYIIVFTSANGVEWFFRRAKLVLGETPSAPPRLYAIGPATAKALRCRGWRAAALSEAFEGEAVARRMSRVSGRRILIPRALAAREILPKLLRKAGARVLAVPAYQTVPDSAGRKLLRRVAAQGRADWVTFASASSVGAFFAALGAKKARRLLRKARAASIGPLTSAALRRRGVEPAAEAARFTAEGLAQALAPPIQALRAALAKALREAGRVLMARFGKTHIRYKGPANLVTEADHAGEQSILDVILSRFPGHGFMSEEREPRSTGSEFTWVIDPLDGTTNYAHAFPVFCVSIALLRRGEPLLGGILDPYRGELFLAERGQGAWLNGRRMRVSRVRSVSRSLLLTGFAYDRAARADYLIRFYKEFMRRCHDVRRSGSAALDLAWTAAGRVDGYWEFSLKPWDVAAGALLVREAGGKVSDFSGRKWAGLKDFGRETLASNGLIHAQMLRVIRKNL